MSCVPLFCVSLSLKSETLEFFRIEHDYYRDHCYRHSFDQQSISVLYSLSYQFHCSSFTSMIAAMGGLLLVYTFCSCCINHNTRNFDVVLLFWSFFFIIIYTNGRKSKMARAFRISFGFFFRSKKHHSCDNSSAGRVEVW
jgi:hypothetical protein